MSKEKITAGLFGDTVKSPLPETGTIAPPKKGVPKELPEISKRGSLLYIPQEMEKRFNEEGYSLAWLRIYIGNGELDVKSIRQKESEGYTFVTRAEAPEMGSGMSSFFKDDVDKHGELISVGDVALGKIPTRILDARERALNEENKRRSKSIVNDLRKHRIGDPSRGDVYKTEVERPKTRDVEFGD